MKNRVASFRPLPLICVAQNIYLALEILGASFYEVQIKTVIGAIIDSVSDYRIQADARTIYYADYVSKSLHCTLFPWLIYNIRRLDSYKKSPKFLCAEKISPAPRGMDFLPHWQFEPLWPFFQPFHKVKCFLGRNNFKLEFISVKLSHKLFQFYGGYAPCYCDLLRIRNFSNFLSIYIFYWIYSADLLLICVLSRINIE